MFTGIITAVGRVAKVEIGAGRDALFEVRAPWRTDDIALGASICHAGACLTVIARGDLGDGGEEAGWWHVQASAETLAKTNLADWAVGTPVNLERSLKLGDELGGHMVSGHVDGVGVVVDVTPDQESWRVRVRAPDALAPLIAAKGSIAVDGVSLTVNAVEGAIFSANIIPHTWAVTTLGGLAPGRRVNLEADLLARYVARILSARD
jgi:riboflavin synthase